MTSRKKQALRTGESHIQAVRERYPGVVLSESWSTDYQPVITVARDSAPVVIEYLYYQRGGWMPVMIGNDERSFNNCFALYYILSMEEEDRCMLTVRVEVPADTCEFYAVSPKVPAAVWSEREVQDMFGLHAIGIIDNRNLVLPDDWPMDIHPLRKDAMDYRYRPAPTRDIENYEFLKETGDHETTTIPMGPMHITSDEPGHFRLYVEGEDIIDADYRMFFVHRGMEKCAEARMDYDNVSFLAERICGICGYAHSVAYSETVERAQGIEVPLRAQYIRAILLETERLHSHLLNLGLVCHYSGFDTGFQHFFRIREKSMDLAELLTGARKTYGYNLIGGVRRDILAEQKLETLRLVGELRADAKRLVDELLSTPNFLKRAQGVGKLDPKIARDYSPVGPCVRGSGFARDARWVHPFDGYAAIAAKHKPITADTCDVFGRTVVRVGEFLDSIDIIEELLSADLPSGIVLNDKFNIDPHKFALGWTEAPRGEDVHWSMIGNDQKCYRWRAKASTYSNWPVLRYMFRGNTISDAALIVGSIDPCYSCTERVSIIDVKKGTEKVVTKQQLETYARTRKHSPLAD
ncbi:NADH-quinone oxidoreductase subunit C [Denitrobacterium detoxificans]|uniref:hydrogenase large subunit n=1 Tax=Denitrobacterium detoxificans TaxID=79604 RepID=UPI0026EF9216|nr:hydrogenase large subunit [Denitrobacterium detoxificans]MBE6466871.1 hydrogenase large subunit [Denitrobacterium detoxificans]